MESTFRELLVWQQAMNLAEEVYKSTSSFPRSEDYALSSQMRRAAVSIPSNIAEGSGRGSSKEYQLFLRVSRGSGRELETHIEIARRVNYLEDNTASALQTSLLSVNRLLSRLIKSLDA
jgi:four helix bundle protein